jgi:hypothetical protein
VAERFWHESEHVPHPHVPFLMVSGEVEKVAIEREPLVSGTLIGKSEPIKHRLDECLDSVITIENYSGRLAK